MRNTLLLTLSLAATLSTLASQTAPGWTKLFDGQTLDGWVVKAAPADRDQTWWRVVDGTIEANSLGRGKHDYVWLYSEREYSDFVLLLKFQAFRDSPGNTGVQIRSRYNETDANGWLNGPQVDINPPGPWRTGMMWDETRGNQRWIFPNLEPGKWVDEGMAAAGLKFHFADDEPAWNDLAIDARGTRVKVSLNGVLIADFDGAGILDDATHKSREVGMKGHIALQIHVNDQLKVQFKDIYLRDLSSEE